MQLHIKRNHLALLQASCYASFTNNNTRVITIFERLLFLNSFEISKFLKYVLSPASAFASLK